MQADDVLLVYITAASREKAVNLARALVERRLAACANILGDITSLYWWKGEVSQEAEVAVIVKTVAGKLTELVSAVKELHDYEVPAVVAVPVVGGNPEFLQWVVRETRCQDRLTNWPQEYIMEETIAEHGERAEEEE